MLFLLTVAFCSEAKERYIIDSKQSQLFCSVSRMALSTVKAQFKDLTGEIVFNPKTWTDKEGRILTKSSVNIQIKTASVSTGSSFIDKKIQSKQLLDTQNYPEITFQSEMIEVKKGQLYVHGVLSLRGIQKEIVFPFHLDEPFINEKKQKVIRAKGRWLINRKDFNVIWSKVFDKGGVIVGNMVAIDWEVTAIRKEEKKPAGKMPSKTTKSLKKKKH